jgi:hypothetical protein
MYSYGCSNPTASRTPRVFGSSRSDVCSSQNYVASKLSASRAHWVTRTTSTDLGRSSSAYEPSYMRDLVIVLTVCVLQEMANPLVRPKVDFYPEDAGPCLKAARHGERWLNELHPSRGTPMIRCHEQDFFVLEATMLIDGSMCMPIRWFEETHQFWGRAWPMRLHNLPQGRHWVVDKSSEVTFSIDRLLLSLPKLRGFESRYDLPPVDSISGGSRTVESQSALADK